MGTMRGTRRASTASIADNGSQSLTPAATHDRSPPKTWGSSQETPLTPRARRPEGGGPDAVGADDANAGDDDAPAVGVGCSHGWRILGRAGRDRHWTKPRVESAARGGG